MSWACWDWPLTWLTNHRPSVLWQCWLGHVTRKIVSEMTYSVKDWCDLENRVRVSSRSLEMAPFDRSHTSSYLPSIVTMAIVSFARYSDLLVENREIFIPHLYLAPPQGVTPSWRYLMLVKLEWLGYRTVKKTDDMLSRFHPIPGRYGRTDRIAISISRVSVLTRNKKRIIPAIITGRIFSFFLLLYYTP